MGQDIYYKEEKNGMQVILGKLGYVAGKLGLEAGLTRRRTGDRRDMIKKDKYRRNGLNCRLTNAETMIWQCGSSRAEYEKWT